jgi:hypothetical protein
VPASKKYTFNLELDAAYDIGPFVGYKKDFFVGGYVGVNGVTRSSPSILAFSEDGKNMLLWSFYLRLEPAIALHKNFYLLGLFGYENWRSDKSWMMVDRGSPRINPQGKIIGVFNPTTTVPGAVSESNFVQVPIDYRDYAYGLGFDWDMLERVGLHGRVKWISHEDRGLNKKYDEWAAEGRGQGALVDPANPDGPRQDVFVPTDNMRNDWSTPVFSLEIKMWF